MELKIVLHEASTEVMIQRPHGIISIKYKVRIFFSSHHNSVMVKTRIAHRVKNIWKKLEVINSNKSKLKLIPNTTSEDVSGIGGEEMCQELVIFGRNAKMKMMIYTICNQDNGITHEHDDVQVYAIWGMGGIEKATLAQLVYNHEKVNHGCVCF
ncbi:Disease resistance protein [Artemisia annua]|uniref:Disease resistance protein n=1 Tax=Artemisia annua TaxID=35608 RepID=A0A2U1QHA8_ARTAN|nr:Disease resistance protein [Artemisia annua]